LIKIHPTTTPDEALIVEDRFSEIKYFKLDNSPEPVPCFLAIAKNQIYVCPINKDEENNTQPFKFNT